MHAYKKADEDTTTHTSTQAKTIQIITHKLVTK